MLGINQSLLSRYKRPSIARKDLKLWLDFEKDGFDRSGNGNNITLNTGKSLSFNGIDNQVPIGDVGSIKSLLFTFTPTDTINSSYSGRRLLGFGASYYGISLGDSTGLLTGETLSVQPDNASRTGTTMTFNAGQSYRVAIVWNAINSYFDIYVDGILKTDLVAGTHSLVNWTNFNLGYNNAASGTPYKGSLSNVQTWNVSWTTSDVTFDYNNPQHLATDNAASSLNLSNLIGLWHLSEGVGSYAYNSAIALGGEEVVNGTFDTDTDWIKGNGATISGGTGNIIGDGTLFGNLKQTSVFTIGKTYIVTIDAVINSGLGLKIQDGANNENIGVITSSGSYIFIYTSVNADLVIGRRTGGTAYDSTIDNVSVKEVSVGEINGATWLTSKSITPQLGLMDSSLITIGSDELTLVQNPNNKGFDILGNPIRVREHGLNLDGTGYGEVPSSSSINLGTGDFTIEFWVKIRDLDIDRILDKRDGSSGYTIYKDASNVIKLELDDGTGNTGYTMTPALNSDQKYHILIEGDRDGNATCYLDNVAQTPVNISAKSGSLDSTSSLFIGADAPSGDSYISEDIIDEVRIYKGLLSKREKDNNYRIAKVKNENESSYSDDYSSDYGF
jgi:hypothetical protein